MPGSDQSRLPVVVMGVSGAGKSTLGAALARALGVPFVEGDALHDAASVAKMHSGLPLDDADRSGWLGRIASQLQDGAQYPLGLVVSCSALKLAYRDRLRRACPGLRFLFLAIEADVARQRLQHREHHFMPAALVPSQFATLEAPGGNEPDVVTLDASGAPASMLSQALAALRRQPPS